jgi:hypothetical protein
LRKPRDAEREPPKIGRRRVQTVDASSIDRASLRPQVVEQLRAHCRPVVSRVRTRPRTRVSPDERLRPRPLASRLRWTVEARDQLREHLEPLCLRQRQHLGDELSYGLSHRPRLDGVGGSIQMHFTRRDSRIVSSTETRGASRRPQRSGKMRVRVIDSRRGDSIAGAVTSHRVPPHEDP